VRLVLGPLKRHRPLRRFIAVVGALPGVVAVRPGHFQRGGVEVDVVYQGTAPLAECLEALAELRLRVESESDGTLLWVRLLSELDDE